MEQLIRKIVREELTALTVSVDMMGEEVPLNVRVAERVAGAQRARRSPASGPRTTLQEYSEVLGGTAGQPATSEGTPAGDTGPGDAGGITPRPVPRPMTDEFLEHEVAPIYRQAVLDGEPPNKTLQETFDRSRSAVSQWLRVCREKGFLPETEPGRVSTFDEVEEG